MPASWSRATRSAPPATWHRSEMTIVRTVGTVKYYNDLKGFGFIALGGERPDLFFHVSQVAEETPLRQGNRVSCIEDFGPDKRPIARQATRA
jgi:cold shock CspA family protein